MKTTFSLDEISEMGRIHSTETRSDHYHYLAANRIQLQIERKLFEIRWTGPDGRRLVSIEERKHGFSRRTFLSAEGGSWVGEKLRRWGNDRDGEDRLCWRDAFCKVHLTGKHNQHGRYITMEVIPSSVKGKSVTLCYPMDVDRRGWRSVGDALVNLAKKKQVHSEDSRTKKRGASFKEVLLKVQEVPLNSNSAAGLEISRGLCEKLQIDLLISNTEEDWSMAKRQLAKAERDWLRNRRGNKEIGKNTSSDIVLHIARVTELGQSSSAAAGPRGEDEAEKEDLRGGTRLDNRIEGSDSAPLEKVQTSSSNSNCSVQNLPGGMEETDVDQPNVDGLQRGNKTRLPLSTDHTNISTKSIGEQIRLKRAEWLAKRSLASMGTKEATNNLATLPELGEDEALTSVATLFEDREEEKVLATDNHSLTIEALNFELEGEMGFIELDDEFDEERDGFGEDRRRVSDSFKYAERNMAEEEEVESRWDKVSLSVLNKALVTVGARLGIREGAKGVDLPTVIKDYDRRIQRAIDKPKRRTAGLKPQTFSESSSSAVF